mmetsp:Transcript_36848/g.84932  ORF Transcript_36848/g.84932 Transcript_36848/m.84932 type:complete len:905 (-) Transcript_36848:171-2885(-)
MEAQEARGDATDEPKRGSFAGKRKKAGADSAELSVTGAEGLDRQGVFIRGLPPSASDKDIQTLLESRVGPTSTCFVIRDDYGVARFRNEEDALRCLEELQGVELQGSQLRFEAAKSKRKGPKDGPGSSVLPRAKRPQAMGAAVTEELEGEAGLPQAAGGSSSSGANCSTFTKPRDETGQVHLRTLMLRGLPRSVGKQRVWQWVQDQLPAGSALESVKRVIGNSDAEGGDSECGYSVTFCKESVARRALETLRTAQLDGRSVSVSLRAAEKGMATTKVGRLIVRNLAFGATLKQIRKAFQHLGQLKEVHIPPAPEGSKNRHRGFAFVQYEDPSLAAKAVEELNGTKICGRGVAIDHAVDAMLFGSLQKQEEERQRRAASTLVGAGEDEDLILETAPAEATLPRKVIEENAEDGEDAGNLENMTAEVAKPKEEEVERMRRLLEDDSKAKEEKPEKNKKIQPDAPKRAPGFDLEKKSTVFVRNIPFEATQEDLSEVFRRFGPLKSVKLVLDKHGQNAHAGKAFVQFRDQAGAAAALADEARAEKKLKEMSALLKRKGDQTNDLIAVDGFGITLKGRRLVVKDALKPEEADKIVEAKQDRKKKKEEEKEMWMHLLHIGEIKDGSQAWFQMSKSEQDQRRASAQERKFRSTNPNFAIHPQRLSIRNLPRSVDATKLRTAIIDYLGQLEGVSTAGTGVKTRRKSAQVLIDKVQLVRDSERKDAENVRKSRGFAFVTFKDHKWAMSTLLHLNNNPAVFGGKKRPIVEFAIEDKRKLQMQKELFQKHAHKLGAQAEADPGAKGHKRTKKHTESRGRRQREKRRAFKEQQQEHEAEKTKRQETKAKEQVLQKKVQASEGMMAVKRRKATAVPDAKQTEISASKRFKKQQVVQGELSDDFELRAMQRFREAGLA